MLVTKTEIAVAQRRVRWATDMQSRLVWVASKNWSSPELDHSAWIRLLCIPKKDP
jgi:hypothetical protein